MSLNDIKLPANMLTGLYRSVLVETGEIKTIPAPVIASDSETAGKSPQSGLKYLGENRKNILIVVNDAEAVHISDADLQFLTRMLTACKLSLADVAIVNLNQQPVSYKEILAELKSRICLLFTVEPSSFGLPMSFPFFQIQPFANCSFLYSPSLSELGNDDLLKSKLWVTLRRLFNI